MLLFEVKLFLGLAKEEATLCYDILYYWGLGAWCLCELPFLHRIYISLVFMFAKDYFRGMFEMILWSDVRNMLKLKRVSFDEAMGAFWIYDKTFSYYLPDKLLLESKGWGEQKSNLSVCYFWYIATEANKIEKKYHSWFQIRHPCIPLPK